jgi:hypothetical protein
MGATGHWVAAKKEYKPIMSSASSGHITKLKQSIFAPFNIYDLGIFFQIYGQTYLSTNIGMQ